jgi:hypothetical protein
VITNNPQTLYTTDADIIKQILVLIQAISKEGELVEIKHIKGHQDRHQGPVSYNASLNIKANRSASAAYHLPQHYRFDTPNTTATLLIKDKIVTSHHIYHL